MGIFYLKGKDGASISIKKVKKNLKCDYNDTFLFKA